MPQSNLRLLSAAGDARIAGKIEHNYNIPRMNRARFEQDCLRFLYSLGPPDRIGQLSPPRGVLWHDLHKVTGEGCSQSPFPGRHVESGRAPKTSMRVWSACAISLSASVASSNIPSSIYPLETRTRLCQLVFKGLEIGTSCRNKTQNPCFSPRSGVPAKGGFIFSTISHASSFGFIRSPTGC